MNRIELSLYELNKQKEWSFDKKFLANAISQGKDELKKNKLSRRKRQSIRIDIETFERFIADNYELMGSSSYKISLPKDISKLKDYILIRMEKQYKILGDYLIRWVMNLSETSIFQENLYSYTEGTNLSIDECAELTIKNYERNSNIFLEPAIRIVYDKSIKQIQFVEDCSGSYCHHDSITGQSYIVIDSDETACIFNHEIQHAIEASLRYPTNILYHELGPIYYEMLFNETLYGIKGKIENGDYQFRIAEAEYLLKEVYDYFKVLLYFAEKKFNITTNEFLETFITFSSINPIYVEEYLRAEIATSNVRENMNYLFSFLKAIELREKKINSNNKQNEILEPYVKRKSFYFQPPQDGFKLYERYVEEMEQKVKKKVRK